MNRMYSEIFVFCMALVCIIGGIFAAIYLADIGLFFGIFGCMIGLLLCMVCCGSMSEEEKERRGSHVGSGGYPRYPRDIEMAR
jgi:hypothetical protein